MRLILVQDYILELLKVLCLSICTHLFSNFILQMYYTCLNNNTVE